MTEPVYNLYSPVYPRVSCCLLFHADPSLLFCSISFFREPHPFFPLSSHPRFTPPPFAPVFVSRLTPHSPPSRFSLHLFAPSLSAPSSLLWSDHKANPYQTELDNAPQNFSQVVFSSVCVCPCVRERGIFVSNWSHWQRIRPVKADRAFKQYPLRKYLTLGGTGLELRLERKRIFFFFCSEGWNSAEIFWN